MQDSSFPRALHQLADVYIMTPSQRPPTSHLTYPRLVLQVVAPRCDSTSPSDSPLSLQVGSLMYMAPELFNGNVYNEKVVSQSGAILAFKLPHFCDQLCPHPPHPPIGVWLLLPSSSH